MSRRKLEIKREFLEESKPRDLSRLAQERMAEINEFDPNLGADPLHIPKEWVPPGMRYRWARESCLNEPDNARMVQIRKQHWQPVPADRHPQLISESFFRESNKLNGFIHYKGLLLVERPEELCKREEMALQKINAEALSTVPDQEKFMGVPGISARFTQSPQPIHSLGPQI